MLTCSDFGWSDRLYNELSLDDFVNLEGNYTVIRLISHAHRIAVKTMETSVAKHFLTGLELW